MIGLLRVKNFFAFILKYSRGRKRDDKTTDALGACPTRDHRVSWSMKAWSRGKMRQRRVAECDGGKLLLPLLLLVSFLWMSHTVVVQPPLMRENLTIRGGEGRPHPHRVCLATSHLLPQTHTHTLLRMSNPMPGPREGDNRKAFRHRCKLIPAGDRSSEEQHAVGL